MKCLSINKLQLWSWHVMLRGSFFEPLWISNLQCTFCNSGPIKNFFSVSNIFVGPWKVYWIKWPCKHCCFCMIGQLGSESPLRLSLFCTGRCPRAEQGKACLSLLFPGLVFSWFPAALLLYPTPICSINASQQPGGAGNWRHRRTGGPTSTKRMFSGEKNVWWKFP